MIELSDKKDREKFKKTAYGKKVYFGLLIAILISLPFTVFEIMVCFIDTSDIDPKFLNLMSGLFVMSAALIAYFDGKKDGAIGQYKADNKKAKKEN